jgi:hypothetical protein
MMATGFVCEYIERIFVEVLNTPRFTVKDFLEKDGSP